MGQFQMARPFWAAPTYLRRGDVISYSTDVWGGAYGWICAPKLCKLF